MKCIAGLVIAMSQDNKHEITETKLSKRKDTYRVQTQSKNRRQKLKFAVIQPFMSERQPRTWEKIRDEPYDGVVENIIKAFKIMMDRDPKIVKELERFIEQNVHDSNLLKEAKGFINTELRRK